LSKTDQTLSPDAAGDAAAGQPTPLPSDGAARPDRGGSISIASGDFTTPMVRKRTITRPRGVPAAVAPVDEADIPTPPPRVDGAAPPAPSQHFSGPALDIPSEPDASEQDISGMDGSGPDHDGMDHGSLNHSGLANSGPDDSSLESEPTLHDQASRLRGAEISINEADQVTPPPVPVMVPAPVALATPATELEPDPGPTPPPQPKLVPPLDVLEREPSGAADLLQDGDNDRNLSPLAHTLANLAEAQRQSEAKENDDIAPEEDLELMDAPLDAQPASPVARPSGPPATPAPSLLTPPPIPGSSTKTPRPEFRGRPDVVLADAKSGELRIPLPAFPIVPEALAQRPRRPKRSKPWFEEIFDEDYLRTLPFMTPEQTMKEVSFIEESLNASSSAEILDVGCGYGRHAIELVQRGLNVTGLDLSLPLLLRAADEAQRRALSVNFVHADMREMPFDRKFDGAYCMLTSFGYFDEDANLRVAEGIARALKPGGRFLLDVVNRDYVVGDLPTRIWWEGVGCVVLEEVDFNFHTSRIVTRRSVVFEDGRQLEQEISVRSYSLHELGRLLRQAGFRVLDISGSMATRGRFFGGTSRNLLILSEKRSE
jgi:SAM-dependent methyltransferase